MNIEAIRKRWQDYYNTATPEQVVAEFEAMGVELVDIDESDVTPFVIDNIELISANYSYAHLKWQDSFLYANTRENIELGSVSVESLLKSNYHYAMAA